MDCSESKNSGALEDLISFYADNKQKRETRVKDIKVSILATEKKLDENFVAGNKPVIILNLRKLKY